MTSSLSSIYGDISVLIVVPLFLAHSLVSAPAPWRPPPPPAAPRPEGRTLLSRLPLNPLHSAGPLASRLSWALNQGRLLERDLLYHLKLLSTSGASADTDWKTPNLVSYFLGPLELLESNTESCELVTPWNSCKPKSNSRIFAVPHSWSSSFSNGLTSNLTEIFRP